MGWVVKIEVYVFKMVSVETGLQVDGTTSQEGKADDAGLRGKTTDVMPSVSEREWYWGATGGSFLGSTHSRVTERRQRVWSRVWIARESVEILF